MDDKLKDGTKTAPKSLWQTVKYFLGRNSDSNIPPIDNGNKISYSNLDKAESFNNFFLSDATLDNTNGPLPSHVPIRNNNTLCSIEATEQDVLGILKSLDTNKATGPDVVSPRMLREAGPAISQSLIRLINMSLQCNWFPETLKLANVLPIHKKIEKNIINNYRPISLHSCVSKDMERVVFKYSFNFIREHGLLSAFQSGFIPGDSTINQLAHVYHIMCEALDKKTEVRVVFCDISKAFDRVWHEGLLYKSEAIGITGSLLLWFQSYLSNRKQKVVIGNNSSCTGQIKTGVPQGSVLGPLLFLVFINDIIENINSDIRLFADDTTLFIDFDDESEAVDLINKDY